MSRAQQERPQPGPRTGGPRHRRRDDQQGACPRPVLDGAAGCILGGVAIGYSSGWTDKAVAEGDGFACRAAMSVEVATGRRGAALPLGDEPQHDDMTGEVWTGVRIGAIAG
jgi:hypothetical protein